MLQPSRSLLLWRLVIHANIFYGLRWHCCELHNGVCLTYEIKLSARQYHLSTSRVIQKLQYQHDSTVTDTNWKSENLWEGVKGEGELQSCCCTICWKLLYWNITWVRCGWAKSCSHKNLKNKIKSEAFS